MSHLPRTSTGSGEAAETRFAATGWPRRLRSGRGTSPTRWSTGSRTGCRFPARPSTTSPTAGRCSRWWPCRRWPPRRCPRTSCARRRGAVRTRLLHAARGRVAHVGRAGPGRRAPAARPADRAARRRPAVAAPGAGTRPTARCGGATMRVVRARHGSRRCGEREPTSIVQASAPATVHRGGTPWSRVPAARRVRTTARLPPGGRSRSNPVTTILMSKGRFLSPDGRCKSFDHRANGYARAEGAAVVVLKSLAAAERDGDRVYAVARGTAVNQEGRTPGITVPSAPALPGRAATQVHPHDLARGRLPDLVPRRLHGRDRALPGLDPGVPPAAPLGAPARPRADPVRPARPVTCRAGRSSAPRPSGSLAGRHRRSRRPGTPAPTVHR